MNKQDIYDKVRAHLLSMDAPATRASALTGGGESCLYLDPDTGRKCAIGCLIPDGHPGQGFLGDVLSLMDEYPDLADLWGVSFDDDEDGQFLYQLQRVHDGNNYGTASHWGPDGLNDRGREALDKIAIEYGLTVEPGGWDA